jgi:hypothetical protein
VSDQEHGTYAAYQTHLRFKTEPCHACRKARNRYMAEYRARRPETLAIDVATAAARLRALKRLAKLHPTQYRALYRQELEREEARAS